MGKVPPHTAVATKCCPLNPNPGNAPTTGDSALPSAPLGKQGRALADPLLPAAAVVAGGEVKPPGLVVPQRSLGGQRCSESALEKDTPGVLDLTTTGYAPNKKQHLYMPL